MKNFIFLLVFTILGTFFLVSPGRANAAFFSNINIPQGLQVKVDSQIKPESIDIYFSNLFLVKKVSYELTYIHDEEPEGVIGEFTPNGKVVIKKNFKLATCSTDECEYHKNISKIKLKIKTAYSYPFNKTETESYSFK